MSERIFTKPNLNTCQHTVFAAIDMTPTRRRPRVFAAIIAKTDARLTTYLHLLMIPLMLPSISVGVLPICCHGVTLCTRFRSASWLVARRLPWRTRRVSRLAFVLVFPSYFYHSTHTMSDLVIIASESMRLPRQIGQIKPRPRRYSVAIVTAVPPYFQRIFPL